MLSYSRNTLKPWDAPRGWTGSTGASTSVPGRRGVGDTDIDPAWADEAFADDGADLAVRSSRLGLAWANAVRMEGGPQVKRRAPTFALAA